ncbi:PIG-L deacetylase family protein [Marispirochaeta sp.]|jgi:LmbE family N-acetylglucosaminyl deacetylase|uniref:PIG-L deacetylase family protein n=1 Tax=Marispirochaeta sp. TaxID=2038653 RepID=UPI0029C9122A|nr:PIG-L deacetylase family protein [Marispirochaeta sp.]
MRFRWQTRPGVPGLEPKAGERWLFLMPHDDDTVIGAGLAVAAAIEAGCTVTVAITTDGGLGYCDAADRNRIASIRRKETEEALQLIGNPAVRFLNFPDGDLSRRQGRRLTGELAGGIQEAYTRLYRELRPDALFLCSASDIHPDHKIVYLEALISLFHAAGDIWPDLGAVLTDLPRIYEFPVYCALENPPEYRLLANDVALERKLTAVAAYRSQRQISLLVDKLKTGGPQEFYRRVEFALYDPQGYAALFEADS